MRCWLKGRPFLILGGQIHNSSAWPSELPQVWQSMAALHANTIEAPVYWEQFEPQQGHFDFTNVDAIVEGARAHNLHVVLLWFGTWKNGNMHYVPSGLGEERHRALSAHHPAGWRADRRAFAHVAQHAGGGQDPRFVALMRHLKQIDNEQHTVILVQVENESGNIGSVRDNSPESNREFAGPVPADLLAAVGKQPGIWSQVFGAEADEIFQVYHQAKYINEIAAAGKKEFAIPCYINAWIGSIRLRSSEQRQMDIGRESTIPAAARCRSWWACGGRLAPSIDMIGPDIYAATRTFTARR
jgi:beta-galactosidase GanA